MNSKLIPQEQNVQTTINVDKKVWESPEVKIFSREIVQGGIDTGIDHPPAPIPFSSAS